MNPVLMVMNARTIRVSLDAIASLDIPKAWFTGFTESQLEAEIPKFVRETDYSHYLMIGDDTLPTQVALAMVLEQAERHEAVTGWSNLSPTLALASTTPGKGLGLMLRFALSLPRPLAWALRKSAGVPPLSALRLVLLRASLPSCTELRSMPPVFRTRHVSWTLTSMTRRLWLKYGFTKPPYFGGSDGFLSMSLARDGVEVWCVRDAFVYHLHSMEGFFVGKVRPKVVVGP